ncbi:OmpA family protein [Stenotrophomonas mori]|uniref:Outer membrane protein assembly factor BamE n=1 Tax=Stenotrophomonas mori TaxID=2871096 RepID=A0ABT0SDW4_9GAMM|nr:OmpA family protein [Stenotrophomonas mori]MCL7713519.1 outer membrane protein assembly factor BamE [Stenotrophomonas mori]
MNIKWVMVAVAALLAGCGGAQVRGDFPDPARAHPAGGTYVNLDDLRQYAPGMNKQQLYALLGTPHFSEGMWGVREWNYLFNFRRSVGAEPIQCQFQVHFDAKGVAIGQAWSPATCATLLQPAAVAAAPPAPAATPEPLRIAADALFAFDRAELSDSGRARLDDVVARLGARAGQVDLTVVGYSDRIGADGYNLALSRRRAEAVRGYLVARGVPAASVQAEGRGNSQPLVECGAAPRAELVRCLAPNRRVEISGIGN